MLPYWPRQLIDLTVNPPPPLSKVLAGGRHHTRSPASSDVASSGETSACRDTSDSNSCDSSDTGTDTDWHWLKEDRLQRTPIEQQAFEDQVIEEQTERAARFASLELSTFPTLCDFLSIDTQDQELHRKPRNGSEKNNVSRMRRRHSRNDRQQSPEPVGPKASWCSGTTDSHCRLLGAPPPPPPPLSADFFCSLSPAHLTSGDNGGGGGSSTCSTNNCNHHRRHCTGRLRSLAQTNNSNRTATAASLTAAAVKSNSNLASGSQAVASGRSLQEIEAAVALTRNNSNQQQRYEMRGGHTVEICSRVEFPDRTTRNVSVTVEATHSNGCHRVIMLKGLTAKKRPDLGPKVKDCRLRMDQIVMTRPSTATQDWLKTITMSYDSDFQVGIGEEKSRPL